MVVVLHFCSVSVSNPCSLVLSCFLPSFNIDKVLNKVTAYITVQQSTWDGYRFKGNIFHFFCTIQSTYVVSQQLSYGIEWMFNEKYHSFLFSFKEEQLKNKNL